MLDFAKSDPLTLGAELEIQLVDDATMELTPRVEGILAGCTAPAGLVQPEIFQSMLEITTPVCRTVAEAEDSLRGTIRGLEPLFRREHVRIVAAGTHPTALYSERKQFPSERYDMLISRNQWVARRLMIFSLHVHVGMPDAATCMAVQNELLWDLPILLAASASSPFWQGEDTGLASSRMAVFEAIPTGGHPCTVPDWAAFETMVNALQRSHSITSLKDLWWDVRPSPGYGTLEIRALDGTVTLSMAGAMVAAIQVAAHAALERVRLGTTRGVPPDWLVRENKWRAGRHGLEADFVSDAQGSVLPMRHALGEALAAWRPAAERLGCAAELERLRPFVHGAPTSADRQREVYARTGSLTDVTQTLADEWTADLRA